MVCKAVLQGLSRGLPAWGLQWALLHLHAFLSVQHLNQVISSHAHHSISRNRKSLFVLLQLLQLNKQASKQTNPLALPKRVHPHTNCTGSVQWGLGDSIPLSTRSDVHRPPALVEPKDPASQKQAILTVTPKLGPLQGGQESNSCL